MRRSATAQCVVWLTCTPVCPVYATMLAPRPESSLRWCGAPPLPRYFRWSSQLYGSSQLSLKTQSAPHASRSDTCGALVPLFCRAVRPGGRGQGLVFIWRLHYLAPATSERSAILVGLTGVLAVPLKPSMRAGAFGTSMVETSVACSKVLVFSTEAVPSALTTV